MTAVMEPSPTITLDRLRAKWKTVPAAGWGRVDTDDLLAWPDAELLDFWETQRRTDTTGDAFSSRGWYHTLYRDVLRGKRVLDVGAGLGMDALTFAQAGAHVTMLDLAESNVALQRRLASLLGLTGRTAHLRLTGLDVLHALPDASFDVVWAQGSLHHAPFAQNRPEVAELARLLRDGGRWIQLAYPRERWEREGKLPFEKWGEKTDGPGTPWAEWYDLPKLLNLLAPASFEVVMAFSFRVHEFNWFDLQKKGGRA